MPRAIRKIGAEYKILSTTDQKTNYGKITHVLLEQAPTQKLYYYASKEYLIPQPWTYYVMRISNYSDITYLSSLKVMSIFASSNKVTGFDSTIYPPVLSNMLGTGYLPCCDYLAQRGAFKAKLEHMVHDAYQHFWAQKGNSEGYEAHNSTFKALARETGYLPTSRARIFNWLSKRSVEDLLKIDFGGEKLDQSWEAMAYLKNIDNPFGEITNAA